MGCYQERGARVTLRIYIARLLLVLLVAVAGGAPCRATAQQPAANSATIEGVWQGTLAVSGLELRIVVEFKKMGPELYTGTLQSLDQDSKLHPLDVVTFKADELHFELKKAMLSWDGKLTKSVNAGTKTETELNGTLTQGAGKLPLNFKRISVAPVLRRPQEPKRPYPYVEEEVLYDNKLAGTQIGGTLTLPKEKGPFPAVLLITGSGQQNRNEELMGHKPFLIIADYLTRQGIAVLRVDDRGAGKSTGDFNKATTADFATDVESGIAFLKSRHDIRPDKIGLIGHSEGGVIAPMVAARSKDVAFIVMLAGTGVDGAQILIAQGELISKAAGANDQVLKFNRHFQEAVFAVLKSEQDPATMEAAINAAIAKEIQLLPEAQRAAVTTETAGSGKIYSSPWMRYFISYDPAPALQKVRCPVLVMNGDKDLQVPATLNLPAIEAALRAGGNKDYSIKLMPGMNHLFQTCQTGAPSEYSKIEETMSPLALKTMGDWITAHCAH